MLSLIRACFLLLKAALLFLPLPLLNLTLFRCILDQHVNVPTSFAYLPLDLNAHFAFLLQAYKFDKMEKYKDSGVVIPRGLVVPNPNLGFENLNS